MHLVEKKVGECFGVEQALLKVSGLVYWYIKGVVNMEEMNGSVCAPPQDNVLDIGKINEKLEVHAKMFMDLMTEYANNFMGREKKLEIAKDAYEAIKEAIVLVNGFGYGIDYHVNYPTYLQVDEWIFTAKELER